MGLKLKLNSVCVLGLLVVTSIVGTATSANHWTYKCTSGNKCEKFRLQTKETATSLGACTLTCGDVASVWPKPTGTLTRANSTSLVNINSIDILVNTGESWESDVRGLVQGAKQRFRQVLESKSGGLPILPGGKSVEVYLKLKDDKKNQISYLGDESYRLQVRPSDDGRIKVTINAENFFGARHALETLSQLIVYDDINAHLIILDTVDLQDSPVYPHRGILLDTARNYVSKKVIKETIEGMALSKLNVFHWHITDSQSFPYVAQSASFLSELGAYTPKKIYTPEDVREIIDFARIRGVKVLPEFDAPAHVGEGWQDTGFLACFNKKPWQSYCVEPPCGQLDPTQDAMYDLLEKIYHDMVQQFDPDVFHMGGDEVNEDCWHSEKRIVDWMTAHNYTINQAGFMKLWDKFQSEALKRFTKIRGRDVPIILWTSTLTDPKYLTTYLPNSTYIIQIWTKGDDPQIKNLLENGYRTILSNYEALYFDCGFSSWVGNGHNWCSPYIGWQTVYDNSPAKIAGEMHKDQMLGAEATLWTEQVDDANVGNRLWPRAAAMAERLWSEPTSGWEEAEDRMLIHRERLVSAGISADMQEPEWCRKYQGSCPVNGVNNIVQ